ncbi:uncharacterized protein LOC9645598 isoform X1 [Selaginella moellendorffii]|uniref:uncharacterized protein LOC9645598 isoform X1 n=1 Tax=Selaginella moellendorffii TaxID=88036 RepID=UPI000D1C2C53|nr:uncharacterized protein LOC9645598 isoform X1 [Selaginella moellendorffii]|eukprot:XP_024536729.1 uncharacterized protein LOC9645598 isoform X1 [Selaginella moellendorffii]
MASLHKAFDGTVKRHPFFFALLILGAAFGIAWRLILRPRPLHVSLQEIDIYQWNLTLGTFNKNQNSIVSSSSKLQFHVRNPSFCWKIDVKEAQIRLSLLTAHFKLPLATGKVEFFPKTIFSFWQRSFLSRTSLRSQLGGFITGARKQQVVRAYVIGDRVPLFFDSKYMPLQGSPFKLLFEAELRSKPRSKWFWVPFDYKHQFECQLSCSIKELSQGRTKLVIQSNLCEEI